MLLTFVIPVYNTAKFVSKCLESILRQGVSAADFEIIVIDDGSIDESGAIVASYAKKTGNLRVISQKNSGLGSARNAGLAEARGHYVWFVDSDDYLADDALGRILELLIQEDPDVLALDYSCADESGMPIDWIRTRFRQGRGPKLKGSEFFDLNYQLTYAWLYIFRTELLRRNGIEFRPRINMQDAEMLPRALFHAHHVHIAETEAYVYVKRSESFINSQNSTIRESYFNSVVEVRNSLVQFGRTVTHEPAFSAGLRKKVNVVEEILFLSFIYDPLDGTQRQRRLEQLQQAGIFPFQFTASGQRFIRLKRNILRSGINWAPGIVSACFALLRRFLQTARKLWTRPHTGEASA